MPYVSASPECPILGMGVRHDAWLYEVEEVAASHTPLIMSRKIRPTSCVYNRPSAPMRGLPPIVSAAIAGQRPAPRQSATLSDGSRNQVLSYNAPMARITYFFVAVLLSTSANAQAQRAGNTD